jgi:hypothetical protein
MSSDTAANPDAAGRAVGCDSATGVGFRNQKGLTEGHDTGNILELSGPVCRASEERWGIQSEATFHAFSPDLPARHLSGFPV